MSLPQKVHKLEQDIIQFKASQDIGSSSSRIRKTVAINYSGSSYGDKYFVGVFKSSGSVHPMIMARLTARLNGQIVPDIFSNGQYATENWCLMNNDTVFMLAQLYDKGTVNDNIFDEYTTGFYLQVRGSGTLTLEGILYATSEGTFTLYAYDP